MSIFGTILSKIFPSNHPAVAQNQQGTPSASAGAQQSAQAPGTASAQGGVRQPQTAGMQATQANAAPVDVERVLDDMAQKNAQKLNWRTSIVDLMKLLNMDSGLEARKTLAQELHYSGDASDSAAMNIWLHKQVMQKLEQNGGKVPQDLVRH